jgi:tRNA dimethylallyltransferase
MDIGTAKPTPDELQRFTHHLINIRDITEDYTLGDFSRDTARILNDIHARNKRALIVGGTGLYLKALLYGIWGQHQPQPTPLAFRKSRDSLESYTNTELHSQLLARDPASGQRIGLNDRYRLIRALEIIATLGKTPSELQSEQPTTPHPKLKCFVTFRPLPELEMRIKARTQSLLQQGLVHEVQTLCKVIGKPIPDSELSPSQAQTYLESLPRPLKAIGYHETLCYLLKLKPEGRKQLPGLAGLENEINLSTRQLARKQTQWFQKEKASIHFFESPETLQTLKQMYA